MRHHAGRLLISTTCAIVVACGVSTQAARREGVAPLAPADAFTRAVATVTNFGYAIADTNRASGLIRAERKTNGGGFSELMTGESIFWGLTITLVPDSAGTRYVVQPSSAKEIHGNRSTKGMVITRAQVSEVDSLTAALRTPRR